MPLINIFVAMKKLFLLLSVSFLSYNGISQKLEFDFIASSLNETILDDYQFIKSHFLGNEVARKVKLLDLTYKWEDPPTPTRSTTLVKIEKQPIYFAIRKVINPKFYKNKIKTKSMSKDEAKSEMMEILDIAIMLRYQETDELESILRGIENGDQVLEVFKNQIELIYF
ncbi:MAG: hypothetical protein CND83_00935 [Rhodothermaeota bacterium MED-G19]|nr:MAG: hypothetical protein CND83_00935 [Rhodothermaeota bacterium MED-G19]